ncbi:MAG: phytanoyl-CoA hydroxylase [Mariniblastus sp.]|jgi:phytanoyl-CoA hydroxylase
MGEAMKTTTEIRNRFNSEGLVYCKSFKTRFEIDDILTNLARVISEVIPEMPSDHVFYEDKSNPATLKQLQQLQVHDQYFGNLMTDGPFRRLAESLLGTQVVCQNMQYFNKPPGIGLATPAHQDGYYFKLEPCEAVTMWMALEPVDEENGCVRYVPGSNHDGMRPHGPTGTLGFSQGITDFPTEQDAASEIAFPAQPGDLLAHHALTIHRAEGNSSQTRSRRALGLIYYSVDAKADAMAWEQYQAKLKSELTDGNKI